MRLEEIVEKNVDLGTLNDIETDNQYYLEIKRQKRKRNGMDLFEISISENDKDNKKKRGRIMFYADLEGDQIVFFGIETYKDSRNQGISNMLLETMFQYSERIGYKMNSTTSQRKPITTFILTKYGFTPRYKSDKRKVNIFPADKSRTKPKLRIGFADNNTESNFKRSNLYKSNQYEIVKDSRESQIGEIMLSSPYNLHNYVRYQEKREQNKKRYKITFHESL